MKIEKILLSIVATLLGLAFAGIAFFIFESTKVIEPENNQTVSKISPTKSPEAPETFLTIDRPKDEEVVKTKSLIIAGKTREDAVITIITNSNEDIVTPSQNGDFSTTVTIDNGQNIIEIIALAPNGESVKIKKIVTYSEEEF
jgi:hypothetical protein